MSPGKFRFNPRKSRETKIREKIYIYGKHALEEALKNVPNAVAKVFLSQEAGDKELLSRLEAMGISVGTIKNKEASWMVGREASHQGVIASINPSMLMREFADFAAGLKPSENTMLVLLDELIDPHNVGAVIRSAAAFGASGVLMPSRNQAQITGAVVKVSAGMAFSIPIVSIGNVNQTIDALKKMGFRSYALAMGGSKIVSGENFETPTLFVVGNEGRGIREKTFEHCDVTLRIPIDPKCESLNASVSAAIVLYQWSVKHPKAIR
jgi:23S rRNA (guanosine2251-2'-O)-methyltransferase